jgi:hypothetical protein
VHTLEESWRVAQQRVIDSAGATSKAMSLIGNFAAKAGLRERRAGLRVATRGLEAFYRSGGEQKPVAIKDIGSTGICLALEEGVSLGSKVALTLRRKVIEEPECGARVLLPSKVVRVGKHDVGLKFLHELIDAAGWSNLVLEAARLSERNDGVRVFRLARARAFLRRISPPAEIQLLDAMCGGMSYDGEERALEILLRADDLLSSREQISRRHISARLVQRILDQGMNLDTRDADMADCWAGLLATATQESTDDEESLKFVHLLSKVDMVSMRIPKACCEEATASGWDRGFVVRQRVHYTAEEIKKIARVTNGMAIVRGVYGLQELSLVHRADHGATFEAVEKVNLTPTELGLRLHARCIGRLEVPEVCRAESGCAW